MISIKYAILFAMMTAGIGYFGGHKDTKIITKTEQVEVVKNDIVTVVKEITKKDGTKKVTTTTTDKSSATKTATDTKIVESSKALNRILVSPGTEDFRDIHSYTVSYERRLAGPVWVGVNYNTRQVYGISVGLEF